MDSMSLSLWTNVYVINIGKVNFFIIWDLLKLIKAHPTAFWKGFSQECSRLFFCLHHSSTPKKKNVKQNFPLLTATFKPSLWPFLLLLLEMQFPHAGHMAAHWTAVYPPHFSIWQPHWAPAAVAPNWLPLISRSEEKQGSSCLFWSKLDYSWQGQSNVRHCCIPTRGFFIRDQNTGL